MRRIGVLSFIALTAVLVLIPRQRPAQTEAPGPLPDKALSFRIVFGERQERLGSSSLRISGIVIIKHFSTVAYCLAVGPFAPPASPSKGSPKYLNTAFVRS